MTEKKPKPKAKKKPGNPPRRVPGRKSEVKQVGQKWVYQFKRNDFQDVEFDTEAEARDYAKHIKNASVKGSPLRVRRGV